MAKLTSEEALNLILNIVDYMALQLDIKEQLTSSLDFSETDKTIVSLLLGIVNTVAKDPLTTAGALLESLAKGITTIKDVDTGDIDKVTTTISSLGLAINDLLIKKSAIGSLESLIEFLLMSGLITKQSVNGLIYMSLVFTKELVDSLNSAINSLDVSKSTIGNVHNFAEALITIGSIPTDEINSLKYLAKTITPEIISSLNSAINSLVVSKATVNNANNFTEALTAIASITSGEFASLKTIASTLTPETIESILNTLNSIKISAAKIDSIIGFSEALNALGQINPENLSRLESISVNIDIDSINKLFEQLNTIDIDTSADFTKITEVFNSLVEFQKNLVDIDISKFDNVAKLMESILLHSDKLTKFANSLKLENPKETVLVALALNLLTKLLAELAVINIDTLLKNLNKLDEKPGKRLGLFLKSIIESIPNDEETRKMLLPLSNFMRGLSSIIDSGVLKMQGSLNPIKARLLGMSIGQFIKGILKSVNKQSGDIKIEMKGLGELLSALTKFADKDSKVSIWRLKRILNLKTGEKIGKFFTALLNGIPDQQDLDKKLQALNNIINSLSKIKTSDAIAIKVFSMSVGEKQGLNISKFINALCKDINPKQLDSVTRSLKQLPIAVMYIVGSIAILAATIAILGVTTTLLAVGLVMVVMYQLKGLIKGLASMGSKEIDKAGKAAKNIGLTVILLMSSLVMAALIVKIFEPEEIFGGILIIGTFLLGIGVILKFLSSKSINIAIKNAGKSLIQLVGILYLLIGALALSTLISSNFSEKNIEDGLLIMLKLTVGMGVVLFLLTLLKKPILEAAGTIISLGITMLLLTATLMILVDLVEKNKDNPEYILYGLGIMALFTTTSLLIFNQLSKINKPKEAALALLAISAFYLITSLTIENVIIPIGHHIVPALIGMALVLGFTELTILMIKQLGDDKYLKDLKQGLISMVALSFIILGISLIIKELIIPIGQEWDSALIGTVYVLGFTEIMILMIHQLGKETHIKHTALAIACLAGMAFVILGISLITKELLIPIGEQWDKALIGTAVVVGLITAFGGIAIAIGKYLPASIKENLVEGAVLLGILGVVMTLCMLPAAAFIKLADKVKTLTADDILATLGIVGAILVGGGVIAGILGQPAIATAVLIGEAVLTGLALVLTLCMAPAFAFVKLAEKVAGLKDGSIADTTGALIAMFGAMAIIAGEIAVIGVVIAAATVVAAPALLGIGTILLLSNGLVDFYKKVNDSITLEQINNTIKLLTDKDQGMIPGLNKIVDAASSIGFIKAAKVAIKMQVLDTMFDTISHFVEIVSKVATMNYISGYDDRGKPIYTKLPPNVFFTASEMVSKGFSTFITELSKSMDKMKNISSSTLQKLGYVLNPIINSISKFVDIVIKVATLKVVDGYDLNGKPIYKQIKPEEFKLAAEKISQSFSTFISNLKDSMDKLKGVSMDSIKALGKALSPVMDSVSTFVDTIIKLATLRVVDGYDLNGKPYYKDLEMSLFEDAATKITNAFSSFITSLSSSMSGMTPYSIDAIKSLGKSLGPVMSGVADYVDAIVKMSTTMVPIEWDETGKPIKFELLDPGVFKDSADKITESFVSFVESLRDNFSDDKWWGNRTQEALDALGGSIGPVMEGLGTYVDSIIKLATGVYVEEYVKDNDGKWIPKYKHLTDTDFTNAAIAIKDAFSLFIDKMIEEASKPEFLKKGAKALELLGESVMPVMEAVANFSKALLPFLEMTKGDKKDVKSKNDYLCMDSTFLTTIATNIANAFVNFVDIISTKLSAGNLADKIEEAEDALSNVKGFMSKISSATRSLADVINSMKDKDGKIFDNNTAIVDTFTTLVKAFAKDLTDNAELYQSAFDNTLTVYNFVSRIKLITREFSNVMSLLINMGGNDIKSEDLIKYIKILNTNMSTLADGAIDVYNKINSLDLGKIQEFMNLYLGLATDLIGLSNMFLLANYITDGINNFIKNLLILTDEKTTVNMAKSGASLTKYSKDLVKFTKQIETTTNFVNNYTISMNKASDALRQLDNVLISRENERNLSLKQFEERINGVTESITNMKGAIEDMKDAFNLLNFDGLLDKCKGIANLILSAIDNIKGIVNIGGSNKDNSNNNNNNGSTTTTTAPPQNNSNNRQNTQTRTTGSIIDIPEGSEYIEFVFADTKLSGFAKKMTN